MTKHKKIQAQKHKNSKKMINDFQNIQYSSIRKIHPGNKIPISKRIKIRVQN